MNRSVLLIRPPGASPASSAWGVFRIAGLLKACRISTQIYEAGADFLAGCILDPDVLEAAWKTLQREAEDAREGQLRQRGKRRPGGWAARIKGAGRWLETLQSPAFYDPSQCADALEGLCDVLALASRLLRPMEIRFHGVFHQGIRTWAEAEKAAGDAAGRSLARFCRERVAAQLKKTAAGRVLICIQSPGEVLGGLALAACLRSEAPGTPVALLWYGPQDAAPAGSVPRFSPRDEDAVLAWARGTPDPMPEAGPIIRGTLSFPAAPWAPRAVLTVGTLWEGAGGQGPGPHPEDLCGKAVKAVVFNAPVSRLGEWLARLPGYAAASPELRFAVTCPLEASARPGDFEESRALGVRLVQWRVPETPSAGVERVLAASARAGLWNHLWFSPGQPRPGPLVRFLQGNPNIVHGWSMGSAAAPPWPADRDPADFGRYGEAVRLPGRPLWNLLADPAYILLYVAEHGTARLMRWWREAGEVETLGSGLRYHFESPGRLPPGYLEEIIRMVEAGGAVNRRWVRHNLERAFLIGYVTERGRIVANSSLKRPRREYVEKVSRQADIDLTGYLERGYTSVRPEYRGLGIGTRLLEGLTARAGGRKIYSVISADNVATQKIAIRNRTRQVASFYSERLGKEIGVWVPEWMMDT